MSLKNWLRLEWDRIAGCLLMAAGAVILLVGLLGVIDSADVVDQLSYLGSGGIGGLFLLGMGATLLLSADLHDDWRKLSRVETELRRIGDLLEHGSDGSRPAEIELREAAATNGVHRRGSTLLASERGAIAIRNARQVSGLGILFAAVVFAYGTARATGDGDFDQASAGVAIAGAGAALVAVMAAANTHRLRRVFRFHREVILDEALALLVPSSVATDRAVAAIGTVWIVEDLPRYHAAGCAALDERPSRSVAVAELPPGLTPCGLCLSSD
jgi:hypothetical protein